MKMQRKLKRFHFMYVYIFNQNHFINLYMRAYLTFLFLLCGLVQIRHTTRNELFKNWLPMELTQLHTMIPYLTLLRR